MNAKASNSMGGVSTILGRGHRVRKTTKRFIENELSDSRVAGETTENAIALPSVHKCSKQSPSSLRRSKHRTPPGDHVVPEGRLHEIANLASVASEVELLVQLKCEQQDASMDTANTVISQVLLDQLNRDIAAKHSALPTCIPARFVPQGRLHEIANLALLKSKLSSILQPSSEQQDAAGDPANTPIPQGLIDEMDREIEAKHATSPAPCCTSSGVRGKKRGRCEADQQAEAVACEKEELQAAGCIKKRAVSQRWASLPPLNKALRSGRGAAAGLE